MYLNKDVVSLGTFTLSLIVRLLFLSTTIYILILCFGQDYSLRTLHVAFCTIGCFLLMTEAILVVSAESLLHAIVSKSVRITIHWVLHVLGLGLLTAGIVMIKVDRAQSDSNDPISLHGKLGQFAVLISWIVGITAIPSVSAKLRPRKLSLAAVKIFHICLGIIAMILLLASQITGLYTEWWLGSELSTNLTLAAYVIGGILLHVKPLYTWSMMIYNHFT